MEPNWQEVKQILVKESEQYRERHTAWSISYYAALLTVFSIFIAICSITESSVELVSLLHKAVILLSIIGCLCIISIIGMFIELYDRLGYDKVPDCESKYENYIELLQQQNDRFTKKSNQRKVKDFLVKFCFINSILALGGTIVIPYFS